MGIFVAVALSQGIYWGLRSEGVNITLGGAVLIGIVAGLLAINLFPRRRYY